MAKSIQFDPVSAPSNVTFIAAVGAPFLNIHLTMACHAPRDTGTVARVDTRAEKVLHAHNIA